MTAAPRITVGEVSAFCEKAGIPRPGLGTVESTAMTEALAAFLRARVPERAVETETTVVRGKQVTIHYCEDECKGFNACRDLVLKGRE